MLGAFQVVLLCLRLLTSPASAAYEKKHKAEEVPIISKFDMEEMCPCMAHVEKGLALGPHSYQASIADCLYSLSLHMACKDMYRLCNETSAGSQNMITKHSLPHVCASWPACMEDFAGSTFGGPIHEVHTQ